MNSANYVLLALLSCGMGCLYFAYNQQWIIIKNPFYSAQERQQIKHHIVSKKTIKQFFWLRGAWHQEVTDILWSEDNVDTLFALISNWLTILDEEKVGTKRILLQSIALSPSQQEVFCSFDRNPFKKEQSIHEKLMWIEGLLKSIRENGIKMQSIRFLVHHQPLLDTHLDFSNSWPLSGFINKV